LPTTRTALTDSQMAELTRVTATTGTDSVLDSLILRLHIETACRRGGALALRVADLDPENCVVQLREKGGTVRWQPISPTLMTSLLHHIEDRGGDAVDWLFRYRGGRKVTRRRYDYIWTLLGQHLPWVATLQVTTHWLRYTTLTWVERNYSYALARAYAGHTESSGSIGATITYVRATTQEVAQALSGLTGEPHPLASTPKTPVPQGAAAPVSPSDL